MLNVLWAALILTAVVVGGLTGAYSGEKGITEAAFSMAKTAVVDIALPLSGIIMLWLGFMKLAEASGLIRALARAISPLLRRLFPEVPRDHPAMGAMIMNIAANMLGIGNAATPLGLKAMTELEKLNPRPGTATNAMCTFLAINTSSVTIIPATAIGVLSSGGVPEPQRIVVTALGATFCSTLVAIVAIKLLERLPRFRLPALSNPGEPANTPVPGPDAISASPEPETAAEEPGAASPVSPRRRAAFAAVLLALLAGLFLLELLPFLREPLRRFLDLPALAAGPRPPAWRLFLDTLGAVAIPFLMLSLLGIAWMRRLPVFELFVEGAREGFQVAVRIMPYLVAMLVAMGMFRDSGALRLLQQGLAPVLRPLGFPVDLLPLALMRPLSGGGSLGILGELVARPEVALNVKYTAATMFGSTETTFYVLAVYFGSVAIRRTRHAVAAGLLADAAGLVAAVVLCRLYFGP